jgi:ferredoxin
VREETPPGSGIDWLHLPGLGAFLRWRHSRTVLQIPPLLIAVAMIVHGLWGPDLAPRNLATVVTWVHFRGLLVLVLLGAGNLFCMACPFMLPRELARRLWRPRWRWPRALRSKWLAIALLVLVLFAYELFSLWSSPFWTAWLILGYFLAAFLVDGLFHKASFCKWVCPIGQFNFVASTLSPLEVTVREPDVCVSCKTKDCIAGRRDPERHEVVRQRGCELELFQPRKVGNMDCTFCLDCAYACPHDNVALTTRLAGSELWSDRRHSGIGFFSRRPDLAALTLAFTFGALVNAFGMVSPVYAVEEWLAARLGTSHRAATLGVLFLLLLVVEPLLLLAGAAWLTRRASGLREPLLPLATRFAYALVPLGFGIWLAHYSFHFFTGLWTILPVAQGALADAGLHLFGAPNFALGGLPQRFVHPLELGFVGLGLLGSLLVAWRIAAREAPDHVARAFVPWAALAVLIGCAAVWLLGQPMEMRATFLDS